LSVDGEAAGPLEAYAAARQALIGQIATTLSHDVRFAAAWLAGSYGRGEVDALSDVDLTVVVAWPASQTLCSHPSTVGNGATGERMALFGQFGIPAIVYENHSNAPAGGTFTTVLYGKSALLVDWTLVPVAGAVRPAQSLLLFDRPGLSVQAPSPGSPEERSSRAANEVAFFWMMAATTIKIVARRDMVKVQWMLEMLHRSVAEVRRLLAGEAWSYHRDSYGALRATTEAQAEAVRGLCTVMLGLTPEVARLGGEVPASPMAEIERLLRLIESRASGQDRLA
jgi:hypothetical protein